MGHTGRAGFRADLIEELVSLKAGKGATYGNVLERAQYLPRLSCVRREMAGLPEDQKHIAVRKALDCAVRRIRFARQRQVLLYVFNFEGAGGSLEARRAEIEQTLGISESTIKRDEREGCEELADVLLALKDSPCGPSPTGGPGESMSPDLVRTIADGVVSNRISGLLRLLSVQDEPSQADAVYQALREGGKLRMGLRLISKLMQLRVHRESGAASVALLIEFVRDYPDSRIDRSPTRGLAANDLEWPRRHLRLGSDSFSSTIESAAFAQERVRDDRVAIYRAGADRPTLYYGQFVRNTFNLLAFHLLREEGHGWPLLKAEIANTRRASRETKGENFSKNQEGGH